MTAEAKELPSLHTFMGWSFLGMEIILSIIALTLFILTVYVIRALKAGPERAECFQVKVSGKELTYRDVGWQQWQPLPGHLRREYASEREAQAHARKLCQDPNQARCAPIFQEPRL